MTEDLFSSTTVKFSAGPFLYYVPQSSGLTWIDNAKAVAGDSWLRTCELFGKHQSPADRHGWNWL